VGNNIEPIPDNAGRELERQSHKQFANKPPDSTKPPSPQSTARCAWETTFSNLHGIPAHTGRELERKSHHTAAYKNSTALPSIQHAPPDHSAHRAATDIYNTPIMPPRIRRLTPTERMKAALELDGFAKSIMAEQLRAMIRMYGIGVIKDGAIDQLCYEILFLDPCRERICVK
jgi:hypothetical protein